MHIVMVPHALCDGAASTFTSALPSTSPLFLLQQYYVLTVLLPIALVGIMGFAIFWFQPSTLAWRFTMVCTRCFPPPPPGDVVTRFQAIITLFLALMAVQFVVNAELPASSYALPTQQFILVRVLHCADRYKSLPMTN